MKKTFKLMLVAVIALLGFSSASAAELVLSTQYDTNGFQYVIKSLVKNQQNQWVGTVSMKKNDFSGTSITINPTVKITVEGTVNNVECKGPIDFKIVEIEANAFAGLSSVTSVTFATGCNVEIIGEGAFAGTSVSELDLTNTKITTLNKLFETNNVKLNSVVLPSTLTTLAPLALADCIQLSSVDFSACTKLATLGAGSLSNTIVSEYDFSNCRYKENNTWHWLDFQAGVNPFVNDVTTTNKNLTTVTLPLIPAAGNTPAYSPVTGIFTVFANCEKLTTIENFEISKVTVVPTLAFENCISLEELTFPASLTNVNGTPFKGCIALETLEFQDNPTIGNGEALYGANEDDLAALKTLKITVASGKATTATIKGAAFYTNTGITTVEIATAGTFTGTIEATALKLAADANSTVSFGNIGKLATTSPAADAVPATLNTIAGPVGTFTTELNLGDWNAVTLGTSPIVNATISAATVKKVNLGGTTLLQAIGQAKVINFDGDIAKNAPIAASGVVNSALTTINFNGKIGDGATVDIIQGTAFDQAAAPNLTDVTWNPATDPTAKVFNIRAFGPELPVGAAAAKVTLHTSAKVAALYNNDEAELHNVKFDAAALDPTPQTISVYGNGSSTYFYGFVKPTASIFIEKTQGNDQVVAYSAFVDSKDQKIYMDPLALTNGRYIIPANQVVVLRMKNPSETEDMTSVAGGKKAVVNAYAAGETDYPTLRIQKWGPGAGDYAYLNHLELTDKIFSSDYIGTTYVGKILYAMANPAVVGELSWNKVEQTSYLPKGAVFVQTDEVTAAAARLELVWLDGADNSEVTGIINNINKQENDGVIYNLQGIRVNGANKGLYIQNGKKFIVK